VFVFQEFEAQPFAGFLQHVQILDLQFDVGKMAQAMLLL
jgi:hypothetical protein